MAFTYSTYKSPCRKDPEEDEDNAGGHDIDEEKYYKLTIVSGFPPVTVDGDTKNLETSHLFKHI